MSRSPHYGTQRDAGFVLVAVLWLMAALAGLATIFATYVVQSATAMRVHLDRAGSEALLAAGVELTAYRLAALGTSVPASGHFDFPVGDAVVAADYRAETARIDLNAAPKDFLAQFFVTLGAPRDRADGYADRIVAWRSPPQAEGLEKGASGRFGERNAPSRGGPFPHVNELALVQGLPPALVERALPFVTVYSGKPGVNLLDAAPEVIASLPGMTADKLAPLLAARASEPQTIRALLPALGLSSTLAEAVPGNVFRIDLRSAGGSTRIPGAAIVVVLLVPNEREPYAVLSWQDTIAGGNR